MCVLEPLKVNGSRDFRYASINDLDRDGLSNHNSSRMVPPRWMNGRWQQKCTNTHRHKCASEEEKENFPFLPFMKNNHTQERKISGVAVDEDGGDGWRKKFNKFSSSFSYSCFIFLRLFPFKLFAFLARSLSFSLLYCSVCSLYFFCLLFMMSGCVVHIDGEYVYIHHTQKKKKLHKN